MTGLRRHRSRDRLPATRKQMVFALVRVLLLVTGLLVAYSLAPLDRPAHLLGVKLLIALVIIAGVLAFNITAVLQSPNPRLRALEALGITLPLLIIAFAATYVTLSHAARSSFNEHLGKTAALYFTVTVFTTVGFGDIVAHSQEARIIVTVQMVVDLILIGVVAKVLLGAVQMRTQSISSGSSEVQPADTPESDDRPSPGSS
jgi:voltage-gated potassium channel